MLTSYRARKGEGKYSKVETVISSGAWVGGLGLEARARSVWRVGARKDAKFLPMGCSM